MRPPIFTCEKFQFIPLTAKTERFVAELDPRLRAKLLAACQILARALAEGRLPAQRTEAIRGTRRSGLFELRGTLPGSRGPQMRLICWRDGARILIVRAFLKRTRAIPRREVELAERALERYLRAADERAGPKRGRGS